jgi:hypothetical protein
MQLPAAPYRGCRTRVAALVLPPVGSPAPLSKTFKDSVSTLIFMGSPVLFHMLLPYGERHPRSRQFASGYRPVTLALDAEEAGSPRDDAIDAVSTGPREDQPNEDQCV